MNISLARELREWVERRAKSSGYASVSEYIRDLVRRDQRQEEAADFLDTPGPWKRNPERLKKVLGDD